MLLKWSNARLWIGTALRGAAERKPGPWLIANEIDICRDPREFNAALKIALANGQTAITIGDGVTRLGDADDMRTGLDGDRPSALSRYSVGAAAGERPKSTELLRAALGP